jgi:hypothetical protein
MANDYTQLSTLYPLKPDQVDEAKKILRDATVAWIEAEDYPFGDEEEKGEPWRRLPGRLEFMDEGIWFAHDESADPGFVADLVSALQKKFSTGQPFYFEYCIWCSKPRLDEFCGGAYAILPDGKIIHVNPRRVAEDLAEKAMKRSLKRKEARR